MYVSTPSGAVCPITTFFPNPDSFAKGEKAVNAKKAFKTERIKAELLSVPVFLRKEKSLS